MWERVLNNYCERGADPAFWAEPLNAATNAGFVLAGAVLLWGMMRETARDPRALSWLLAGLVVAIGIGSFLFHTFATRWAGALDVFPILVFILTSIFLVARRGFGAPLWASLLTIPGYFGLVFLFIEGGRAVGLSGGVLGYGPALLVLVGSGLALRLMGRPGGPALMAASAVFALSLTFRQLDRPYCGLWTLGDVRIGTHFLWHLLNAATLYLVARALIRQAGGGPTAAIASPGSTSAPRPA